ncbi:MAG TPA: uracil-DNA glycosylase [Candidatus Eisenbacteria bacterium]|nr:uracil-DNA glycosylase [Candidatus Eisenbacteria bacterium]
MTSRAPDDPRQEAAELVAAARRWLDREAAAGLGDLIATSTLRAKEESADPEPSAPVPSAHVPSAHVPSVPVPPVREPQGLRTAVADNPFDELDPGGVAERAEIERDSGAFLEAIATEVRACTLCGLCETRTQAVPGVGSARSGIVFVGEAPGADEDRRGEPFVGRAGELLTRIIKAMDDAKLIPGVPLTRETVFICNVLKCRPPENRNPLPHEIESCAPYLRRQLQALRPRLICCLGKFAAELLVGVKGTIGGLRGKVYRYQGAKLLVTYHPAACLRNPAYKRPVWEDMQLLAREYLSD